MNYCAPLLEFGGLLALALTANYVAVRVFQRVLQEGSSLRRRVVLLLAGIFYLLVILYTVFGSRGQYTKSVEPNAFRIIPDTMKFCRLISNRIRSGKTITVMELTLCIRC